MTAFRALSPMSRPDSQLRLSSDGEESFMGFPQLDATNKVKFQDLTGPNIVINGKVDDINIGMEMYPGSLRPSSPTQIPKHPNLISRLTTKLRITAPPSSPPPNVLSFHPQSPTYAAPHFNTFVSTELPEPARHEQGLFFPKDSNFQREPQDIYFLPVRDERDQDQDQDQDQEWITEAERVKETWEAKHLGVTAQAAESGRTTPPLESKGPIYPEVLATPQFGMSKSTPDLTQIKPLGLQRVSTETDDESTAAQFTSTRPAFRHSLLEPTQLSKLPTNVQERLRTSSSTSSQCTFLGPQKWVRFTRDISPVPVDANAPFASSTSLVSGSSHSFISSAGNSFLMDERFMHSMSAGLTRYPASGESSERASVDENTSTGRHNPFDVTTRSLDIERTPTIVKRHTEDGDVAASIIVQVEGSTDVARLNFPSRESPEPNSRGRQEVLSTAPDNIRLGAAGLHMAEVYEGANSFQGRSQRRKSFVEQSFQNLRKSITVTISRARSGPPPKSSLQSTSDTSQHPLSPTSAPVRRRLSSSAWRSRGTGLERRMSDLRRYTIRER